MAAPIFFQKVERLCKQEGISVNKLTKKIGVSSSLATGWRNGATPRPENVKAIAEFFKKPIEYFSDEISISNSPVTTNNGAIGNFHAPVTISNGHERPLSQNEIEMIRMFGKLPAIDQAKVLVFTNELLDKNKK